jgi:hypothetical protein
MDRELRRIRVFEGFGGAADDLAEIGAAPAGLQKQVVGPPKRQQAAFDGVLRGCRLRDVAQALGGDGADGRERVLDAVVGALPGSVSAACQKPHARGRRCRPGRALSAS